MKFFNSALFVLCVSLSLQAQTPPTPAAPAVPVKPAATPTPASTPAAKPSVPARPPVPIPGRAAPAVQPVNQGVPAQGFDGKVNPNGIAVAAGGNIGGENMDDQDVADEYTKYTGKRVLLSSATQNLEIRFVQRGPLTNAQAADLLDKIINMEGFAFVPSGVNEVKLLPKGQGTGANAPEDTEIMIDDPNDIPDGDAYVSYFMKLNYIKPEEAVRTFTQSIHGLGPGAKIAPVPNASAVIVTGKSSFIRKLINQKQYIDVAAGNVSTSWVAMKYADAEEVATSLNEIMNSQKQSKTTAGVTTGGTANRATPPVPGRGGAAANAAGSSGSSTAAGEDIPVQIVANPRLNKIFIMGRPVDIVFVEGLARAFDAPPNRNNYVKRRLRFMIASDFLTVAADALESVGGSIGGGQQGGAAGGGRQNAGRNNNNNRNTGNTGNNNRGGQNGGGGAAAESVQEFNVSDVPESLVIGKTLLVADNLANSILVKGPPESIRIVSELIDQLDGRPQQVMISTVFGEVTLGEDHDVGVSFGRTLRPGDRAAGSSTPGGPLVDLGTLGDIAGLNAAATGATAGGLNIYGTIRKLDIAVRALQANSDFKILSRPTVYTANNRKAIISSGRRIAVPTNTFTSGGTGAASQSTNIEYRDVLLRFEVVPLINSEEEVTLRISLLNEDTQGTQNIDGNLIPTIVTESLSTTVTVPNHATVALGGLVTETETNTKSGVPVLSRIPALGRLFRRDVKSVTRKELLIFIQPKIVNGDASQKHAQSDMERRYNVAPSTRDFADGVLPSKPKTRTAAPRKPKTSTKATVPSATKRPGIRYPTRR